MNIATTQQVLQAITEFNRYFTSANGAAPNARISVPTAEWQALHTMLAGVLAQPAEGGEPLFILHCGQIDSSGEQDELETEANGQQRVDDFCRLHPGKKIKLYPAPPASQEQAQQPSVTVRYDLSPAMVEGAIRDRLIAMGWTPPLQQPKPQPMTDWISVDDRLPQVGQEVLVYRPLAHETNDPHIALRQYIGGSHKSPQGVEHGFDCWCHPSHWMQRPPSPHDDAHHGITSDKEA